MSAVAPNDLEAPDPGLSVASTSPPTLTWVLAGLMAGAGAIHLAMVPAHAGGESFIDPLGFALVAWFQLGIAAAVLANKVGPGLYKATIVGNLAVMGLWVWSRTVGLPIGSHSGIHEEVGSIDLAATAMAAAGVVVASWLLLAPERSNIGRVAPAMIAVGLLGLTTTVITSPDATAHGGAGHSHGTTETADGGHGHDDPAAHTAQMATMDATRCDKAFNPQSYWDDAAYLGIDTYFGGAMATDVHAAITPVTEPDPTGGRGSAGLDDLVSLTDAAGGGEIAAAALVNGLSAASDEDYAAWLWWFRKTQTAAHSHDAAAPDESGHGGHNGPSPWVAMTDPTDCARLQGELADAREVALALPHPTDAIAAGYELVTPYVPGIAAHYMNFDYVDGEFELEKPEMVLYDGAGDDANVVGLSYYILHEGDAEPMQGFTGANDHFHRHIGLCIKGGVTIGDSTLTAEECEAMGGRKSENSRGWMSHAWVVPGCESPWGVFSGANPLLDNVLGSKSGTDGGACAGSGVLDRYNLEPGVNAAQEAANGDTEEASGD